MPRSSPRLVRTLIGVQAANALFDAIALYPVAESTTWGAWAKQWAREDLDRLGFPQRYRFVFPVIKAGSVAGLLVGIRRRTLARFTAAAIVAYFVAALGFHVRAKDSAVKFAPAVAMLILSLRTLRVLSASRTVSTDHVVGRIRIAVVASGGPAGPPL